MIIENPSFSLIRRLQLLSEETERGIGFISGADDEIFISYAGFVEKTRRCLTVLLEAGLSKGNEVVIRIEDPFSFLIIFWACIGGGMIPIPLSAGNQTENKRKAKRVWHQLADPWMISDQKQEHNDEGYSQEDGGRWLDPEAVLIAASEAEPSLFGEAGDIAYVQYSSGSTGDPKGVTLTHANISANVEAILGRSQTTKADSMLSWMPLTHDMGMICFHLCGIYAGIDQYILPTGLFIRRPLLWIQAASDKKITQLYSPNFGFQFFLLAFQRSAPADWDLSGIRIIYNGAEQISAKICGEFTTALESSGLKANVVYPGYGLAEACVAVTLPDPGDVLKGYYVDRSSLRSGQKIQFSSEDAGQPYFVEVGYPVPDCLVRITHAGKVLPQGTMGGIEIKGSNVTSGYYRMPELTGGLLSKDGWLNTGDLGFLQDGRLVITGRRKNMIVKNGLNYFPHDLENILLKVPGIEVGGLAVTSCWNTIAETEEVLVFIQFKKDAHMFTPLREVVQTDLLSEAGLLVDQVIPVRRMPKTTSGKIQHFKLTDAYLKGEYASVLRVASFGADDIAGVAGQWWPDISSDTDLSCLNSLQLVRLVTAVQKRTGRQLTISDVYAHPTPRQLAVHLGNREDASRNIPAIGPAVSQDTYPVLLLQRKMWVLEQEEGRKGLFNLSVAVDLAGVADLDRMEWAFGELLRRHESLRSRFKWEGNALRMKVSDPSANDRHVQVRNVERAHREEEMRREANTAFDLEKDKLIRIIVWQDGSKKDLLHVIVHHIVADGWSIQLLLDEFNSLYFDNRTPAELSPATPLQLKDYCCWYTDLAEPGRLQEAEKYWIKEFGEGIELMQLPFRGAGRQPSFQKGVVDSKLNAAQVEKVDGLARGLKLSRFTVLVSLLHSIFHRYSRQASVVTGVEIANRGSEDLAQILGPLANTLLIRSVFTPETSLKMLARQLQEKLIQATAFESVSFDRLREMLLQEKIDHPWPMFNTLIIYHNFTSLFKGPLIVTDQRVKAIGTDHALCDLVLELMDVADGVSITINYDAGLFTRLEILTLLENFFVLAEELLNKPGERIDQAEYLSAAEVNELSVLGRGRRSEYRSCDIGDLLTAAVGQYPEGTALVCGDKTLTYSELDNAVSAIAARLTGEYGLGPGMPVALMASVSERTIPMMFAIWRVGGIYVPIDPHLPESRIRYILEDSCSVLVMTENDISGYNAQENKMTDFGRDPACVLYTSGTTGYPKGIIIGHESLADYVQTFIKWFGIGCKDIVVQLASIHFDVSLEEILPVIIAGGKLVVAPGGGRDVHALLDLVEREQVTVMSSTPAVIQEINYINPSLQSLRLLVSGGDRLEPGHIDNLAGRHFEIYNTYGPAEVTLCATYHRVEVRDRSIPIGKPIDNREVYLLDESLRLLPRGETGEICIGGRGLAACYLNQPGLTQEKFVPHLLDEGKLMYRTGDLGRWLEDGSLEFAGRKDDQLKIRGYRVECGEVEQMINRLGHCSSIVVPVAPESGERFLVAYISGIAAQDLSELVVALRAQLPDPMIPADFIWLEKFPVTNNGKIDKDRLPKRPRGTWIFEASAPQPETVTQKKLAKIWQEILETDLIGSDSDFLQLGGHSLKIVRLISRIKNEWNIKLTLKDVFEHTVLKAMAGYLDGLKPVRIFPIEKIRSGGASAYEMSHGQRRLWILDRLYPGNIAYNLIMACGMDGWPGMDRVTDVLLSLIERHESLRTVFDMVGDQPRQIILSPGAERVVAGYRDLRESMDAEAVVAECGRQEAAFIFDLIRGPLVRIHLFGLPEEKFIVLFNIHHIVCDGWSMEVLVKEFVAGIREDCRKNAAASVQYKDYSAWQTGIVQSARGREMKEFWRSRLSGELPVLSLPTDHERPAIKTFRGKLARFVIPDELWGGFRRLQEEEHTSMYVVLLASVYAFLNKESGLNDILIGTATAGRDHIELEEQVGLFANTVPLRIAVREDRSFRELVRDVHRYVIDTFEYREYPFDLIIEDLGIERDMSRYPLFDILVNYDDRKPYRQYAERFGVRHLAMAQEISKFDIIFHFEEGDRLTMTMEYATDLFCEDTIQRYFAHFETLLRKVLPDPEQALMEISLLTEQEQGVIARFNDTGFLYSRELTLDESFAFQARQTPDLAAVICSDLEYSYGYIDKLAGKLAGSLQRDYGVGREDRVVLLLEPSEKMLIAILAVLRCGAAYVPIGTEYPDDRIAYVVNDVEPSIIITDRQETSYSGEVIKLYLPGMTWDDPDGTCLPAGHSVADPAYIIYTSGSTGNPKGVVVRHFNVINLLLWLADHLSITSPKTLLSISSYAFDISVLEYFLPWLTGGAVILTTQRERKDAAGLVRMLHEYNPDIFQSTPSLLAMLVNEGWRGGDRLTVISGGETLPKDLALRLVRMSRTMLNMYGPTETTIYSSLFNVTTGAGRVHIGKPVANTKIYILDKRRFIQPIGVVGEIGISGDGLAAGYFNRPLLNNEKFIEHPYAPGERLYLTGDLGRQTHDGEIEFVGRFDSQVKISGYRIECGEIENALTEAGVAKAVVLPLEDLSKNRYLAAYLEGVSEEGLAEVKQRLLRILPAYMMPTAWMLLDRMPLNANGKADRKLLEKMPVSRQISGEKQDSKVVDILLGIWREVLKTDQITPQDDLFRIGGHSLAALKIINAVNERFNVEWTMKEIFVHTTVGSMADILEPAGKGTKKAIPIAAPADGYPLSHGQYRLWLLNSLRPGNPAYNLPAGFRLKGPFRSDLFARAIGLLIARHEILRTAFFWKAGAPWQRIFSAGECGVMVDLADRRGQDPDMIIEEISVQNSLYCFDLEKAPLLNIRVIRIGEDDHLLFLNIHHIICDGWSIEIMLQEVSSYYTALQSDPGYEPPALSLQYKDFAVWQRSSGHPAGLPEHREFWVDHLRDASTVIDMSADGIRPKNRSGKGGQRRLTFPPDLSHELRRLAVDADASLFMTLLSLIRILLMKYSGQRDLTLGVVMAGRTHSELDQQVGFYVNTLPMRSIIDPGRSFMDFLSEERERILAGFQHQDYPLDLIIGDSRLQTDVGRTDIFDVVVNYQAVQQQLNFTLPAVSIITLPNKDHSSKFDLTIDILEGDEIIVNFEYNTDIYEGNAIDRMLVHLGNIARQICGDPSIPLHSVQLTTSPGRQLILDNFTGMTISAKTEDTVVSLFKAQVARSFLETALTDELSTLTYAEADRESNRMCRYLVQEYGVVPGGRVALVADREVRSVLWILAILKAGAAYIPMDIDYPAARMELIVEDTEAILVLTDRRLYIQSKIPIVEMDSAAYASFSGEALTEGPSAEDVAYIIYTSGSTGRPKGVPVCHRNIVRLVKRQNYLDFDEEHRLLQTGSFSFDASTFEIWGMLLNGWQLHLLAKDKLMDAGRLKERIREASITTMWFTAAWFNQLVEQDVSIFAPLKILLVGGDRLSIGHIRMVKDKYSELRIINGYGPTEATTFSACHEITREDLEQGKIPIGRPIKTSQVYILDEGMNLQPAGVCGEICIGGEGLSPGYWKDSKLTEEKFVDHPFCTGEKIYRTGDLGYLREDGVILFKGRRDHQVKIRGYRVECGEIESFIQQAGGAQAVVSVHRQDSTNELYLVAYVTGIPPEDQPGFKTKLGRQIPGYMIPAEIFYMEQFPLSVSGKIDRALLPSPDGGLVDRSGRLPESEMERLLARLWERLLGISGVGPDHHFFESGGHSLKAMRLIALLSDELGISISYKDIFTFPVLHSMAARLEYANGGHRRIEKAPVMDHYPLSFNQYGLWVATQKISNDKAYSILGAYMLTGNPDTARLARAFGLIIGRHESLRTVFRMMDGDIRQVILDEEYAQSCIMHYDWCGQPGNSGRIAGWIADESSHSFDLSAGPLLRIHIVRLEPEKVMLIVNMHHIIADGWSMDILVKEIKEGYNALSGNPAFTPAGLDRQYKDFAWWQREREKAGGFLEAQDYWLRMFSNGIPELHLDRLGLARHGKTSDPEKITIPIEAGLAERIRQFTAELNISHFVFFLNSWNILLYRMTSQKRFVMASPVADRHTDMLDQIGCYINTILIPFMAKEGMTGSDLLSECAGIVVGSMQYREYPLSMLVGKIRELKLPVSDTVFTVGCSWFDYEQDDLDLGEIKVSPIGNQVGFPKSKLWLAGHSRGGEMQFSLAYDPLFIIGATAHLLGRRLKRAMESFLRNPDSSLEELDIRLEEEIALDNMENYQEVSFDF